MFEELTPPCWPRISPPSHVCAVTHSNTQLFLSFRGVSSASGQQTGGGRSFRVERRPLWWDVARGLLKLRSCYLCFSSERRTAETRRHPRVQWVFYFLFTCLLNFVTKKKKRCSTGVVQRDESAFNAGVFFMCVCVCVWFALH